MTEVIYKAFCLDEAPGQINGAPNETRTPKILRLN